MLSFRFIKLSFDLSLHKSSTRISIRKQQGRKVWTHFNKLWLFLLLSLVIHERTRFFFLRFLLRNLYESYDPFEIQHSNPCHWIQFWIFLLSFLWRRICWKMDKRQKGIKGKSCCVTMYQCRFYWIWIQVKEEKWFFFSRKVSLLGIKEIFNLLHSTDCMISCNRVCLISFSYVKRNDFFVDFIYNSQMQNANFLQERMEKVHEVYLQFVQ